MKNITEIVCGIAFGSVLSMFCFAYSWGLADYLIGISTNKIGVWGFGTFTVLFALLPPIVLAKNTKMKIWLFVVIAAIPPLAIFFPSLVNGILNSEKDSFVIYGPQMVAVAALVIGATVGKSIKKPNN